MNTRCDKCHPTYGQCRDCWNAHILQQLSSARAEAEQARAEARTAFRRGAEAMRDLAANNCAGLICSSQIRALAIPESK